MRFPDFARAHGLLIRDLIDDGRIHRCSTENKPRARNGAYKYCGTWGWVQDWSIHESAQIWIDTDKRDAREIEELRRRARADMAATMQAEQQRRSAAALEAARIINACDAGTHPYLERKGFPNEIGLIDYDGRLVVPMRDVRSYDRVQSLQWIDAEGNKKFMTGGAAKGGVLIIGVGSESWLCEGYATGLSVRAALKTLYRRARVVVCFSAGNLVHVSRQLTGVRYVVADNDASGTGQKSAEDTGLPWCMPPTVGHDANDYHQAAGVMALAGLLRGLVVQPKRAAM